MSLSLSAFFLRLKQMRRILESVAGIWREKLLYRILSRETQMHYLNGRAAREGDIVWGNSYNVKGPFIGVLLKITNKDSDVCNCIVARTLNVTPVDQNHNIIVPGIRQEPWGPTVDTDYTECKKLLHISDYINQQESSNEPKYI